MKHTIHQRIIESIIPLLVNSTCPIDSHRMLLLIWGKFLYEKPTYTKIMSIVLTCMLADMFVYIK